MKSETTDLVVKKPVQALIMIPKIGRLTVTARKLFNVILHTTQQQMTEFKKQNKAIPATHMFSARLCDLLSPIQVGKSNLGEIGKSSLYEMATTQIEWDSPDAKKGVAWGLTHLLSQVELTHADGKEAIGSSNKSALIAKWSFPPKIIETLENPENYAQVNIIQIAKLTSYEALVLYEICTRYRSNPTQLTNKSDPEWWVKALSNKQPALDSVTNKPKLRPWPKFKDDKIKSAIAEINEKTDLDIELIELKVGRTIVYVQFKVIRKDQNSPEDISNSQSGKMSPEIAAQATKAGLSLSDVSSVIKNAVDESVLKIGLSKLEDRIARQDLVPIDHKLAYLKKVMTDSDQYITTTPPAKPVPALAPTTVALSAKEQRRADVRVEVRADYLLLSKEAQQPYAILALEALKTTGSRNPSLARAIDSGEWVKNSLLMSKIVEIYAIATRGPEWFNGPAKDA